VDPLNIAAPDAPITAVGAGDLEALEDTPLCLDGVPPYPALPTPENVR